MIERIIRRLLIIYEHIKFIDEKTQKDRYAVCMKCEHKHFEFCGICKCFLPAKTRVRMQRCPDRRW